jgi:hypothetical protein
MAAAQLQAKEPSRNRRVGLGAAWMGTGGPP